jgi:thioredoxin-like negative regulator of GroEL
MRMPSVWSPGWVLDAADSPEAIQWWSRLDSLQPGNADTILAWAAAAMKTGDTPTAERVLKMLAPTGRETAAFHVVSAKIAQSKKETGDAVNHWGAADGGNRWT